MYVFLGQSNVFSLINLLPSQSFLYSLYLILVFCSLFDHLCLSHYAHTPCDIHTHRFEKSSEGEGSTVTRQWTGVKCLVLSLSPPGASMERKCERDEKQEGQVTGSVDTSIYMLSVSVVRLQGTYDERQTTRQTDVLGRLTLALVGCVVGG